MTFTNLQTAYDRQLPDEPESTQLTYDSISNDNLWYIAEKLVEQVADGKSMEWRYCNNIHIVSEDTVISSMCESKEMRRLVAISMGGTDIGRLNQELFDKLAKDEIYNHIVTSEEMPAGYDWEHFL